MDEFSTHDFLTQAVVLLAAGVIGVGLTKRLGLSAVLGYLAAGLVIGPWGLAFFHDPEQILHFAELGIVLLLFVIGLELQPTRLWAMRRAVFGLGLLQVGLTGAVLSVAAAAMGLAPAAAVIVGLTLALSSTAFALQVLAEKNQLSARHGRAAFSVLLLQDLAVIPLLAALPLLADGTGAFTAARLVDAAEVVGALVAVVLGGRLVLRYGFRVASGTRVREIFAAATLLTVVGMALLMEWLGLSMALGAFLAGVLLADSEYRHALEADIDAFRGLLLGLFFIAVGMSVDVGLLIREAGWVALGVAGLVATKTLVLFALGRWQGLSPGAAGKFATILSQGGEFAFVILTAAVAVALLPQATAQFLTVVVIGSMLTTPFLFAAAEHLSPRPQAPAEPEAPPLGGRVIIAGFGRFGQIVARVLRARGIQFTALDIDPSQIDFVQKFGNKVYFGDATRPELLRAAGADDARALAIAVDDPEVATRMTRVAKENFPALRVHARAHDRRHAYLLIEAGADSIMRETFLSALEMTRQVLLDVGLSERESGRLVETFRRHDEERLAESVAHHTDEERMVYLAQEAAAQLEQLFAEDAEDEALRQGAG